MTSKNESAGDLAGGLTAIRQAYAQQVLAAAGVADAAIERAFAHVPRETFLGPGPWQMVGKLGPELASDPAHLYTDRSVAISPALQIYNGQPSFHAQLIAAAQPKEGEHMVHVGAGAGYYTALLAELAGTTGHVTAIERLPELAMRAKTHLRSYPNVEVIEGDGAAIPINKADIIYVNAGATRPADAWLDGLSEGGRLILPLTTAAPFSKSFDKITTGVVFAIQRCGGEHRARWITDVAILSCAGSRDELSARALADALAKGGEREVTRLYRSTALPEERIWLKAPGWCLAYH